MKITLLIEDDGNTEGGGVYVMVPVGYEPLAYHVGAALSHTSEVIMNELVRMAVSEPHMKHYKPSEILALDDNAMERMLMKYPLSEVKVINVRRNPAPEPGQAVNEFEKL